MFRKTLVTLLVSLSVLAMANAAFAQGRKMGLFVGINEYQDGIGRLKSCVNDAVNMQSKLVNGYGFSKSNTLLLTDAQATRQRILTELANYEKRAASGDLFVFYYSGHGSVYPDAESLEPDETEQFGMPGRFPSGYYDSTLVPVDARQSTSGKKWKNNILDDEINEIFSRFTANGVQVVFISDSCHSGTLGKNLVDTKKTFKFVAPKTLGFKAEEWETVAKRKGRKSNKEFNDLFLVVGSSRDDQFSQAGGAAEMSLFTKVLIAKLDDYAAANKVFTYQTIKDEVNPLVDSLSQKEQSPRLDDRFFNSALLKKPIFTLLNRKLKIIAKIIDENKKPVSDASFGVFLKTANLDKNQIRKEDALMLGYTDARGFFESTTENLKYGSPTLPSGVYKIKVSKPGYQASVKEMNLVEIKDGAAIFEYVLYKE